MLQIAINSLKLAILFVLLFISIPNRTLGQIFLEENQKITWLYINVGDAPDSVIKNIKNKDYTGIFIYEKNINYINRYLSEVKNPNLLAVCFLSSDLMEIPEKLFELSSLEMLSFGGTKISKISPKISNLKNLKAIDLENTNITEINNLKGNSNIKAIGLSSNSNLNIDKSIKIIFKYMKVEDLYLRDLNVTESPKSICKIKTLKRLDLTDNKIKSIKNMDKCIGSIEQIALGRNDFPSEEIKRIKNIKGTIFHFDSGSPDGWWWTSDKK